MPDANMGLEGRGFEHASIQRANRRMICLRTMSKAWETVTKQQEKLAEEPATIGNMVTADAFYHCIALYYGKAQLHHRRDGAIKLELHISCVRHYEKAIAGYNYTIEQIVLPFEGKNTYGIFHALKGALNLLMILLTPRTDMIKEDYPNLNNDFLVRRNMRVLMMNGPGSGETCIHGLSVTLTNYPEAASLFLDWLYGWSEVNPGQVRVFGSSMGSYCGPTVTVDNSRTKAVVGLLGCYLEKNLQLNSCQPRFCNNFKYMYSIYDDDALGEFVAEMVLKKAVNRLEVPFLMSMDKFDEMCPPKLIERFFRMLDCLKEMWITGDEFYSYADMHYELFVWAIDWLCGALTTGKPENLEIGRVTPER